jgi:hypothetical protein
MTDMFVQGRISKSMVKRSYNRALYIVGMVSGFGFSLYSLKEAWDVQNSLTPTCSEFCADLGGLRNEDVGMAILALFIVVALFFGLRSAEHRDQRRQLAAKNHQNAVPFADKRSKISSETLILPITIRTRLKLRNVIDLYILDWGITTIILTMVWIVAIFNTTLHLKDEYLALIFCSAFMYVAMTIIPLIAVISLREKMEISQEGMSISSNGRDRRVTWSDVRLFARPPLIPNQKTYPQFEIASAKSRLVWSFQGEGHGFLAGPQPTIPYEEYARIMEALPALITAKTGMPLDDLR